MSPVHGGLTIQNLDDLHVSCRLKKSCGLHCNAASRSETKLVTRFLAFRNSWHLPKMRLRWAWLYDCMGAIQHRSDMAAVSFSTISAMSLRSVHKSRTRKLVTASRDFCSPDHISWQKGCGSKFTIHPLFGGALHEAIISLAVQGGQRHVSL